MQARRPDRARTTRKQRDVITPPRANTITPARNFTGSLPRWPRPRSRNAPSDNESLWRPAVSSKVLAWAVAEPRLAPRARSTAWGRLEVLPDPSAASLCLEKAKVAGLAEGSPGRPVRRRAPHTVFKRIIACHTGGAFAATDQKQEDASCARQEWRCSPGHDRNLALPDQTAACASRSRQPDDRVRLRASPLTCAG